jgi:transcriptional regulator with XRE-family HTH domain
MGKGARRKPDRLAEKLRAIRVALGLSQPEMLRHLGLEDSMQYARISEYETGLREPTLITLREYARVAAVHLEDIVDDELELPGKLPGNVRYKSIRRKSTSRTKGR